jgi:hypothetical protein
LRIDPARTPDKLKALLTDMAQNARTVLAQDDEPAPAAANMADALRLSEAAGVEPPPEAVEAFDSLLEGCKAPLRETIAASRLPNPAATQVLAAIQQLELAREAEDIAFDVRQISLLAERLLGGPEALADSKVASFAVELQADHAIALPGVQGTSQDWVPKSINAPSETAIDLSNAMSLPSVLMGIDADGRLVRTIADGGRVEPTVRESLDVFSEDELQKWSRQFPFLYGNRRNDPQPVS